MAKRRASGVESDEEEAHIESSPAPKRARFRDNEDGGADRKKPAEREDDEEEVEVEEGDEDIKFEEKFKDKIQTSIHNGTKHQGGVAQCGIIQSLEMIHFMCHKWLSFTFGPQINFIIGHNGSGKSAVLSAITVALGGKAQSTGRGNGLKAFIREGENAAEVTITLKNEGEDAYRPEVYGKSIVITRRFTKEGTSSYKIKSKEGRLISTKKEELSAICDHVNIHVDNPMNILSQDSARQFLSSSHPREKYNFFMKGTQLKQLSDEYTTCHENVGKTAKILDVKREALPDLKKAAKDAEARYNGAKKALEQRAKVKELRQELAWAHVKTKEQEWVDKLEEATRADQKPLRINENLVKAQAEYDGANQAIAAIEDELTELGTEKHLTDRKKEVQDKLRANKDKLSRFKNDEKRMNDEINASKRLIEHYTKEINAETAKLQEDKQAEREERERKMDAVKAEIEGLDGQLRIVNDDMRTEQGRQTELGDQIRAQETEMANAQSTMNQCSNAIDRVVREMKNRLDVFGSNMEAVLARIRTQQWRGQIPTGPLGRFVTVKDPTWRHVLQTQIGQMMFAFAITDPADRPALKRILQETNNGRAQIVVAERDDFDFSAGLPNNDHLTVYKAIEVSDPYVLRILINNNRIERTYLSARREEGQGIVDSLPNGGLVWTVDGHIVRSYGPDDGGSTNSMQRLNPSDPRTSLFQPDNATERHRELQRQGQEADVKHDLAKKRVAELKTEQASCSRRFQELEGRARRLNYELRNARERRDALHAELNEDVPVNISALEDAKKESEDNKESVARQYSDLLTQRSVVEQEQLPLLEERDDLSRQIAEFTDKRNEIQARMETQVDNRVKAQNNKKHWEKKLKEAEDLCQVLRQRANDLEAEFQMWSTKAEEFCDGKRIESTGNVADLDRAIQSVEHSLREQERLNGASVEDIEEDMNVARRRLKLAEKELKEMLALNKQIKKSLMVRLNRWHEFRKHIALRTKMHFQYHLATRGYYGKLLFNHDHESLQLKVQTEEQAATQSGADKDPKSLSGGEKSYSTICLLLSLWEAIGCPIRCLDEFDVFMDAVNRRISMKKMIDTANTSDGKQYILITPQDMSHVEKGPTVRIHRMGDPERGQSNLAFS
ncbi:P-loop containing nucleoside triphosphate hydrolase protein [Schizopora paradoxa]|uniref:p-loop containing nucleoside triphosphate hydrolase protein n=1 Tax=Schizopora paradoxa TaxID=27342 RepID=A0A0H2RLW8_9AGAM|nr:P-loop containing nucleoside triphosphate hydrolase protein [Schizopora paradoxa]